MLQTDDQDHLHALSQTFRDPNLEARLTASPVTAEEWRTAIYSFVAAQTHIAPSVWFALPASSDPVYSVAVKLHQSAARECQQAKQAAVAFLAVMGFLLRMVCTVLDDPALVELYQLDDLPFSPSNTTMCSMLLILQTIAVLDHTSQEARTHTVKVLSLLQDNLPDESATLVLLAAQPPGINPGLIVKVVQQVLPLLDQALKHMPSAARLYLDILSQMRTLAPAHVLADELVQQGRLLFWSSRNCMYVMQNVSKSRSGYRNSNCIPNSC